MTRPSRDGRVSRGPSPPRQSLRDQAGQQDNPEDPSRRFRGASETRTAASHTRVVRSDTRAAGAAQAGPRARLLHSAVDRRGEPLLRRSPPEGDLVSSPPSATSHLPSRCRGSLLSRDSSAGSKSGAPSRSSPTHSIGRPEMPLRPLRKLNSSPLSPAGASPLQWLWSPASARSIDSRATMPSRSTAVSAQPSISRRRGVATVPSYGTRTIYSSGSW